MQVEVYGNDLESALQKFKKLISVDGVLTSIKLREFFPNATDRKRAKAKRAERRKKKKEAKMERIIQ